MFQKVASFVNKFRKQSGRYPSEDEIKGWIKTDKSDSYAEGIGLDPNHGVGSDIQGCEPLNGFHVLASDRFVLINWNGNDFDCFAFPSGSTNMQPSASMRMKDHGWRFMLYDLIMGAGFVAVANFLAPKRVRAGPSTR